MHGTLAIVLRSAAFASWAAIACTLTQWTADASSLRRQNPKTVEPAPSEQPVATEVAQPLCLGLGGHTFFLAQQSSVDEIRVSQESSDSEARAKVTLRTEVSERSVALSGTTEKRVSFWPEMSMNVVRISIDAVSENACVTTVELLYQGNVVAQLHPENL